MDGRTITVPLAWHPRQPAGTPAQRACWELAGTRAPGGAGAWHLGLPDGAAA